MSARIACDICVIGAGSGGLSVAAGAAQMGASVVLIEAGEMGGDCLNTGCVPSKALIAAAAEAEARRGDAAFGVAPGQADVDYATAMDHVAATIAAIAPHDSQERFEGLGVTVIRERARFTGPREVQAGDTAVTARRFVIATGSRPLVPPVPGLDKVPHLTSETLWALRQRPAHLLVLGGGPIGMELAQAHRRLGSEVTVFEAAEVLGREDRELADMLAARIAAEGVRLLQGQAVTGVSGSEGAITLETADGKKHQGSHLLVAVGRVASTEGLGLEAAGVATDRGGIVIDSGLRTTNRRIFALGDVAGQGRFTHLAGYQAGIVIRRAVLGLPARARADHIPRATYTDPELSQVGLTEAEARAKYPQKLQILRAPLAENDRARAQRQTFGMVKVMAVSGRPVGVTILAPEAGEQIALWSLMLANRMKLSALVGTVLPYPTLAEASKRAAGAYFSAKLFDNPWLKRLVGFIQRTFP